MPNSARTPSSKPMVNGALTGGGRSLARADATGLGTIGEGDVADETLGVDLGEPCRLDPDGGAAIAVGGAGIMDRRTLEIVGDDVARAGRLAMLELHQQLRIAETD